MLRGLMEMNRKKKIQLPSRKDYTAVDNVFLGAINNLSLPAYRIFAVLASQITRDDVEFSEYEIRAEELEQLLDCKNKNQIYQMMKTATNELHEIKVQIESEQILQQYPWLTKSSYLKNEGTAILQFHEDIKPFLLRLNRKFSKIWFSQTFEFKSKTAKNMYLFLCSRRNLKEFKISIDNLKERLSIDIKAYPRFYDFNKKVLKASQKEIHSKTLLNFEYEIEKAGKKIRYIVFKIKLLREHLKDVIQIPKLHEPDEITKLKAEYYKAVEIHSLHLLNDATEVDISEFKKEHKDGIEFAFENGKPKPLLFKSFLIFKQPFEKFEDWMKKQEIHLSNETIDILAEEVGK
jgi:plasmid replication initiation protein